VAGPGQEPDSPLRRRRPPSRRRTPSRGSAIFRAGTSQQEQPGLRKCAAALTTRPACRKASSPYVHEPHRPRLSAYAHGRPTLQARRPAPGSGWAGTDCGATGRIRGTQSPAVAPHSRRPAWRDCRRKGVDCSGCLVGQADQSASPRTPRAGIRRGGQDLRQLFVAVGHKTDGDPHMAASIWQNVERRPGRDTHALAGKPDNGS
jgi:hypothetical protein